jgi:hypothetical protein
MPVEVWRSAAGGKATEQGRDGAKPPRRAAAENEEQVRAPEPQSARAQSSRPLTLD